jgi:hypothetical protein
MARIGDVMNMLIPSGEWVQVGDTFEGITFLGSEKITKAQYEAGFAKVDSMKAEAEAKAAADKAAATAKLEALGLTADDLQALGL